MGAYGYCVVPAGHPPPLEIAGVGAAPVEVLMAGDLAVWLSTVDRPDPDLAAIKAHNAVVEAAVTEASTPVPLRFGQWADSAQDLVAAIQGRAGWYGDKLRLFAGALEFGLRVVDFERTPPARVVQPAPAVSGREYMQGLVERAAAARTDRAEAQRIAAAISESLGSLARAEKLDAAGRTSHALAEAAHLVGRADFEAYRAAALALRSRFPELRFLVSGPWAPYSFAA